MGKFSCYAVYNGKNPTDGTTVSKVCATWNECYALTHGVENVKYKGFNSQEEALAWINSQDEKEEDKPELSLPDWAGQQKKTEKKPKTEKEIALVGKVINWQLHDIVALLNEDGKDVYTEDQISNVKGYILLIEKELGLGK